MAKGPVHNRPKRTSRGKKARAAETKALIKKHGVKWWQAMQLWRGLSQKHNPQTAGTRL